MWIPVFFNILPHFVFSIPFMADAGQLFSHSVLMLELLFSVCSFFLCLQGNVVIGKVLSNVYKFVAIVQLY